MAPFFRKYHPITIDRSLITRLVVSLLLISFSGGCERGSTPDTSAQQEVEPPVFVVDPEERLPAPDTSVKLTGELARHFALIQKGQPDAARVRLRRYLDAQPQEGLAHFLFGLTYHTEKRYGLALESFSRAREFAPTYGQTAYFQGWALYYMGQPVEAQEAVLWYLQGSPENADAHFLLGLLAYEQGDLEEANNRLNRSVSLFENSIKPQGKDLGKALVRLADVQVQQGNIERAYDSLAKAVILIPESPEVHYKLAQVLRRQGLADQAAQSQKIYEALWKKEHPTTSFPE
ncbi:MAG: tetratricopeptide repeat protein [Phycisphaerales bacterium]|nr:tetratricopeptide repeat protein [Phycisphaerales bacterium]